MSGKKSELWPSLEKLAETPNGSAVACSVARIADLDAELGAFLHLADEEQKEKNLSDKGGKLSGVPLAIKDNIAVRNMPLTCASRVLEGHCPDYHATAVTRLLKEGAVIVGKTNMDEFAMGSSTETSAFGLCRNPWDKQCVPGGSSGGSAVAVAAGLTPVALGSDTGGSVRQPAAFCGLVGFKPSYGEVSRFGLVSYASSLDQIGILSTAVADAECVFDIIRGPDGRDETLVEQARFESGAEGSSAGSPVRVGLIRGFGSAPTSDAGVSNALDTAVDRLASMGAEVVDLEIPELDESVVPAYYLTASAEASSNLARYEGVRYGKRLVNDEDTTFEMMIRTRSSFGIEVKLRMLLGAFVLRAGHYDHFYGRAQIARRRITRGLARAFEKVDFLLLPSTPTRAFRLGELIDDPVQMKLADLYTVVANLAGLPAIALPVDVHDALPTSVQLMAPRFGDKGLLDFASKLERTLAFDIEACPARSRGPMRSQP